MNGTRNAVREFVERGEEAEKLGKDGTDDKRGNEIPDEEIDDSDFGRTTFFPGNTRMSKVSDKSSNNVRDEAVEPE